MNIKENFITVTFMYWAKILSIAKEDLFSDGKDFLVKYGKHLLIFLAVLFFSSAGIVSANELSLIESELFSKIALDARIFLYASFAVLFAIFVFVPPKLDKKQRAEIKKLSPNNNKIIVTNFDFYDPNLPFERKTGITIHNNNKVPFINVSLELMETNWRKLDPIKSISLTEKIGVLADNSHFKCWANSGKNFVRGEDKETIYFHQIENNEAVALLENRKELLEYTEFFNDGKAVGFIEIIFEVRGNIGDGFFKQRYAQFIDYQYFTRAKNKVDVERPQPSPTNVQSHGQARKPSGARITKNVLGLVPNV